MPLELISIPLILEGKQPGGQLTTTSEVENFPGFPEGIDGYSLMEHLRKQALKFGARVENAFVDRVALGESEKSLFAGEKIYQAKSIIIATGAAPRLLGVPGEKELFEGKESQHAQLVTARFIAVWMWLLWAGAIPPAKRLFFSNPVLH